jgi:hypothetical protein
VLEISGSALARRRRSDTLRAMKAKSQKKDSTEMRALWAQLLR